MTYAWKATYKNGSCIESKEARYEDIDRSQLSLFELFCVETGEVKIKLKFEEGQRLIWRKRHILKLGKGEEVIHIVGKQETKDGKNYQGFIWLFEDGTMEVGEQFREGHPFFDNIQLLDIEK